MDKFFFGNINTVSDDNLNRSCDLESKNCFQSFFDPSNYKRDYVKGKSFKFSVWNEIDTYNNDEFIQDFVRYDQKLWACIGNPVTGIIPTTESEEWQLILEGISDVEFREIGGELQYKWEDSEDDSWITIFKIETISEEDIKNMFGELKIEPFDDKLSYSSTNAVQNKVITTKFDTKQDIIPDLFEIRQKAMSALQNIPNEYITKSEIDKMIIEITDAELNNLFS